MYSFSAGAEPRGQPAALRTTHDVRGTAQLRAQCTQVFCVSLYADWNEEQINEATTKACQRSYAFGKARPSPPWISCVRARVLVRACARVRARARACALFGAVLPAIRSGGLPPHCRRSLRVS